VKKKTLNLVFDAFPVNNTHPSLAIWAVARHYYGVKVLYIPSLSVLYVWFVCLRLVLPMSLNCTSLSVHSVFSNVYLSCQAILSKRWLLFRAEYNILLKTGNNWYDLEGRTPHFCYRFVFNVLSLNIQWYSCQWNI
jgi:hypothetical protein